MKHYLLTTLLLIASMLHAADKTKQVPISFVSFEQGWLDDKCTLVLKNNTSEEIIKVDFQLIYYDMKGHQRDYAEFSERVKIAPGMSRKIHVDAYERGRGYSYYKSEHRPTGGASFKVAFKLTDYTTLKAAIAAAKANTPKTSSTASQTPVVADISAPLPEATSQALGLMSSPDLSLVALIRLYLLISLVFGLYALVLAMAINRHRNPALWVILSVFTTPLGAILLLLLAGKSNPAPHYQQPPQSEEVLKTPAEWAYEDYLRHVRK